MSRLFVILQYLLPHHLLSRFIGFFADSGFLKNFFIRSFIRRYKVDMSEAAITDPAGYPNFNTFFTRELKTGARPIAAGSDVVVCPADGAISALGAIEDDKLLQAKAHEFKLVDLLGGDDDLAAAYRNGCFATVYLSPRDYHRVHLPLAGQLIKTAYIPGRLFSVNQVTTESVPNLFARNERAVCVFNTSVGTMCVILVGAMLVAGIETMWGGQICPTSGARKMRVSEYGNHEPPIELATGAEIGRFKLGSTAIVLFPPGTVKLDESLGPNSPVKMGQLLGRFIEQS